MQLRLFTLSHYEIEEFVKKNGYGRYRLTFADGSKIVKRLAISTDGDLMVMRKRSRKYGSSWCIFKNVVHIEYLDKKKKFSSEIEELLEACRQNRKVWLKCHPNIWQHYAAGWRTITDEEILAFLFAHAGDPELTSKLKDFLSERDCGFYFPVKVVYLSSLKPTRGGEEEYEKLMKELKHNLDNRIEADYRWYGFYDYTVSLRFEGFKEGCGVACLSCEYRGCGNGHYYILINEKCALWCEDD